MSVWSYVQGGVTGHTAGSQTSLSIAFSGSVTAGDEIRAGLAMNFAQTPSCTDNAATPNTYTLITSGIDTGQIGAYMFRAVANATGPLTVKFQVVTATLMSGVIDEFLALGTVAADGTPAGTFGTSATPSAGSCPVTGTDLVYAILGTFSTTAPTNGTGFTVGGSLPFVGGTNYGICSIYALNLTSPATPTWNTSNTNYGACGASWSASGSGLYLPWIYGDQIEEMYG